MQTLRKLTAIFCVMALLLTILPTIGQAADLTYQREEAIGSNLSLTTLNQKGSTTARHSVSLDYTPGGSVRPIVIYGSKVYGTLNADAAVKYAESLGYTVMAAVNADFFNMSTGVPTGMLIQQGRLLVSDGAWNAVGIFTDGTVICGTPRLSMSLSRQSNGQTLPITALNKVRTNAGIYLYSADFYADTRTVNAGTEVLLESVDGSPLALGKPLTLRVVKVSKTAATPLSPNQFVLSLTDANTAGLSLSSFVPGEEITIHATTQDPRWHNAYYTTGGGNMLVSDGVITGDAAANSVEPRTVLGVRPDGTVSILVCDGRQSGFSDGMTLLEAAQIMIARGCTNVINLDGGGSSSASARYAGEGSVSLVTSPSGGVLRQCSTFIVFVNAGDPMGLEWGAAVYPRDPIVLAGASLKLHALSYNADYFPKNAYYDFFVVSQGGGTVIRDTYTAPLTAGTARVDAMINDLVSDGTTIQIVETAPVFALTRGGSNTALSAISAAAGESIDLDVSLSDGMRPILCQDTQFTFSVTGNIGTIDEHGVFTATPIPGLSGSITAAYGEMSLTLPVTVGSTPQVLESFEGTPGYTVSAAYESTVAQAEVSHAPENARYGTGALNLRYTTTETGEVIRYTAAAPLSLPKGATDLSMMIRGSGDFSIDYVTANGLISVPLIAGDSWSLLSVSIPQGATAIAGFSTTVASHLSGEVHIDQIMCHYGAVICDVDAPVIGDLYFDGMLFETTVTDDFPLPVTKPMVSLTMDGQPMDFDYDADSGRVSVIFETMPEGFHRITLTASDYFQNIRRESIIFGETGGAVFADMEGHWAADYAVYLLERGVIAPDENFNPGNQVTNAMAATMLSRYLGIDTALYALVELPYYDVFNIPDWALPHIKAMYALGMMVGSFDGVNRVFYPQRAASRAQIMTILGRTIPRGYAYEAAAFDDYQQIPTWAADHINLLSSLDIVGGYAGTQEVRPLNTITRAEVVSLLFKLY